MTQNRLRRVSASASSDIGLKDVGSDERLGEAYGFSSRPEITEIPSAPEGLIIGNRQSMTVVRHMFTTDNDTGTFIDSMLLPPFLPSIRTPEGKREEGIRFECAACKTS